MIRVVLLGMGVRGGHWRDAVKKNPSSQLVGVMELRTDIAGLDVPIFGSVEEVLAVEPDAAIIATPPETHLSLVNPLLTAGVPVLCEKPLSESLGEAVSMAHLAEQTRTPLLVGMNFRYTPAMAAKRRLVEHRELGQPIFGEFRYIRNRDGTRQDLNDYPLTMEDPMLVEQSIHHFDLMRYVYGREAVVVSAATWNPPTSVYQHDSCVAALIEFDRNLVVSYLGTWTSGWSGFDFRWRTDFEHGVVVQPDQFGDVLMARRDPTLSGSGPLFDPVGEQLQGLRVGPSTPFEEDTAALLEHFLGVVQGDQPPGPTAEDHLKTLNLLDAIKHAAQTREVVSVAQQAETNGVA